MEPGGRHRHRRPACSPPSDSTRPSSAAARPARPGRRHVSPAQGRVPKDFLDGRTSGRCRPSPTRSTLRDVFDSAGYEKFLRNMLMSRANSPVGGGEYEEIYCSTPTHRAQVGAALHQRGKRRAPDRRPRRAVEPLIVETNVELHCRRRRRHVQAEVGAVLAVDHFAFDDGRPPPAGSAAARCRLPRAAVGMGVARHPEVDSWRGSARERPEPRNRAPPPPARADAQQRANPAPPPTPAMKRVPPAGRDERDGERPRPQWRHAPRAAAAGGAAPCGAAAPEGTLRRRPRWGAAPRPSACHLKPRLAPRLCPLSPLPCAVQVGRLAIDRRTRPAAALVRPRTGRSEARATAGPRQPSRRPRRPRRHRRRDTTAGLPAAGGATERRLLPGTASSQRTVPRWPRRRASGRADGRRANGQRPARRRARDGHRVGAGGGGSGVPPASSGARASR